MSMKKEESSAKYSTGEKVLCFHGPLLYEAKILNVKLQDGDYRYFVHYQGWNKNWDEWVLDSRMFKYDQVGLRKQKELEKLATSGKKIKVLRKADLKNQPYPPPEICDQLVNSVQPVDNCSEVSESPKTVTGDDTIVDPSEADSQKPSQKPEELLPVPPPPPAPSAQSEQPPNPPSVGGRKRKARNQASTTGETDEGFLSRARINVVFPDVLKAWLVDDWDLTTKQSRLFDLPARKPISTILDEYLEQAAQERRTTDTPSAQDVKEPALTQDLRQEFAAGIRVNFNFVLGSQLLYKFERPQYADMLKSYTGKEMADLYGPPHLLRLLVKLREIITFVKVDNGSVTLLETIGADFISFLERNHEEYFKLEDYTVATPDYLRAALC